MDRRVERAFVRQHKRRYHEFPLDRDPKQLPVFNNYSMRLVPRKDRL